MAGIGRLVGVVTVAASMLVLGAVPVFAAPPSNDAVAGAKPIAAGFGEVIDTSEARRG